MLEYNNDDFEFFGRKLFGRKVTCTFKFNLKISDLSMLSVSKVEIYSSVTAAPELILRGYELRYGPLGVYRMCLGCFESDSKKLFDS